jgi:hypothetical protein
MDTNIKIVPEKFSTRFKKGEERVTNNPYHFKKGMVPWNKGIPRTQELKDKLSKMLSGRKLPKEQREKISMGLVGKQTGNKHWNWKGGISSLNEIVRHSFSIKEWRTGVFKRDHYTCQGCGAKNGNGKRVKLEAHHLKPFSLYPELRFNISNGKTLCRSCHDLTKTKLFIPENGDTVEVAHSHVGTWS